MPPRKRNPASVSTKTKKARVKLAQNLSLSVEEEQEVRAAFDHFTDPKELGEEVIQTRNLKKAFSALGFDLSVGEVRDIKETVDPDDGGLVTYELFLEVAAMKIKGRDEELEVDKAFSLFTGGDDEGPITLQHLKKAASALNENVDEETLKDMLREASSSSNGLEVDKRDFADVMRRAGIL
ncbi:hypothetical protein DRE_02260 [Drechslerella stenobrocha 248]|uniref:Calmodulin n=1 Tax=Drechslerella stenobrocha 248 TaxID=1043628 RepID=W7HVE2_9PEZI|nr:hypothetical protein DRE_02260 [Drechslerella stenobrocha 248]